MTDKNMIEDSTEEIKEKNFFKKHLRFFVCLFVALAIFAVAILIEYFAKERKYNWMRYVSDGAFISGLLMVIAGLCCVVARNGGFDLFLFTGKKIGQNLRRRNTLEKRPNLTYFDFIQNRKNRPKRPVRQFFIVGAAFVLLSIVFALLIMNYVV